MLKLTLTKLRARSYASWQTPGSIKIRVSSLVVDDISAESMKRSDAIPSRACGPEVGGILLGTSKENEIVVDDFEPVLCEHRFGPSFRLSDSDRTGWRETLLRIRQREDLAVVGWYRTDTRQEFALSEDDRELLETELQPYGDVILLLKPSRSQPYEAKLFLRDDGQLRELPQATYFEFDRRAAGFLPPSAEPAVRGEPTAWTEASAGRTAAREPDDSVPTPLVESESEHSPPIETASDGEAPTAPVPREAESASFAGPRVLQNPDTPAPGPESEPIGPRFLVQQPPGQKSRKLSFIIAAVLLATLGGTLGYYSLRPRPAAPASRRSAEQAPASPDTRQMAAAPADASTAQPAETELTVQPPKAAEHEPVEADTDRQVRLFLHKWADAEKSANIGEVDDFYAPKLSRYFTRRGVTRADVRAAKAREEARYGRLIVCDIKDISVNLPDKDHAVTKFRKRWQTAGPRVLMGEQQEQLTLIRNRGKWQIGAEQRTKLYWVRKELYVPASQRTARPAK